MTAYLQIIVLTLCTTVLTVTSLWLLVGPLGQFSLCHAALCAVGAYASSLFSMRFFDFPLTAAVALCIGGATGGLAGLFSGLPAAKLKKEHITLSTLAFGEIIRSLLTNLPWLGGYGFFRGSAGQSLIGIPPLFDTGTVVFITGAGLVFLAFINHSPFGRACRAVRDDEAAAQSVGVCPARIKIIAFCLAGMIAGISGCLFAHGIGTLSPGSFSYAKSTEYALFCVPAGDHLLSAVLWALLGAFLPTLLAPLGKHRMVIYALCVLAYILRKAKKGETT